MSEELYLKLLQEGEQGIYDYFHDSILADTQNEEEADEKADEQTDEYLEKLPMNNQLIEDIASIIVEEQTKSMEMADWNEFAESGEMLDALLMQIGKKFSINPRWTSKTSAESFAKPNLMVEEVSQYLKEKYHVLSDEEMDIPKIFKNKLIKKVIDTVNSQAKEKLRRVGEFETTGDEGPAYFKEILNNFVINDKVINNPKQILPTIKPQRIQTARMLDNKELEEIKGQVEEFIENYGQRPHLTPLLEKIDMLLEDSKIYLVDISADQLIGRLDLKSLSRRKAIYDFWKKRYAYQETSGPDGLPTMKEVSAKFKKSLLDFQKGGKNQIPTDLSNLIDEFVAQHDKMEQNDGFSYIVKFDPDSPDLRTKMNISKLQKDDDNALNILYQFLEKTYPELLEDQEEYENLTDTEYEETFSGLASQGEGRIDVKAGLRNKETGEKEGPKGELDLGQSSQRSKDAKDLADAIQSFGMSAVDPLFLYAVDSGDMFANVAIFIEEMERIKNKVIEYSKHGGFVLQDGDPEFKKLERFLEKIEDETLEIDSQPRHLPLTPTLKLMLEDLEITELNGKKISDLDNDEDIGQYLQIIEKFIDYGKPLQTSREPTVTNPQEAIGAGASRLTGAIAVQGGYSGPRRDFREEIEDFNDIFEDVLEMVNKFYIIPTKSRYLPFNDKGPSWSTRKYTTKLGSIRSEATADSMATLLAMQLKWGASLVETDWLNEITDVLIAIGSQSEDSIDSSVMLNQFESLVRLLNAIYAKSGHNVSTEVKIEIGASLFDILKRNQMETDIEFFGKTTKDWKRIFNEQEEAGGKIYPLEALIYHLFSREGEYTQREANRETTEGRRRKAFKEFFDAVKSLKITKSEIDLKILEGHDVIRKMMDKPVYFRTNKVDNFNHLSSTIDLVEKKYNTGVTSLEIEGIVGDQDSHENISKRYGVSKEVVYYVKGNFR